MESELRSARDIFCEAVELPVGEPRAQFLEQACHAQPDLRARVDALLAAYDKAGRFLEGGANAATELAVAGEREPPDALIGNMIGPYKLLQRIGEGGMGIVFMAEQTEPVQRKVALKLIRPGLDSPEVMARVEAERQALALMDHPNIAKVLDAGTTTSGRPYFVMELVHGVAITQYCDSHHLTPRQRLELFIPVCQAVQHAHQKGIIHRDLKPTNVLVAQYDSGPVPKVIDFGVAKAVGAKLIEKTLFTAFGSIIGTLEYMSPEQAERSQLDIDTRSDVYSLGVLLYELLTGTTPLEPRRLREASVLELLRTIREQDPPTPSHRLSTVAELPAIAANRSLEPARLSGMLRGELDWIVMKALEKNRGRRYETASGLAQDIQRYLGNEPVLAGPPSAAYRWSKFVARHRTQVTAAALVLAALVLGVVGTSVGWMSAARAWRNARIAEEQEREQRAHAEAEAQRAAAAEALAKLKEQKALKNEAEASHQALLAASARHAVQVDTAFYAWERRDVRQAERLLVETDPEFQPTWEHRYLADLCRRTAVPLMGHTASVSTVAVAANGGSIVTGSFDGTIRVWNATTGQTTLVLNGQLGRILAVAVTPDGRQIAAASGEWNEERFAYTKGELKIWDVASGGVTHTLAGHEGAVFAVEFNRAGTAVASGGQDKTVRIWEVATGQQVQLIDHPFQVTSLAYLGDSPRLASWAGGNVKVWNTDSGAELAAFRGGHTALGAMAGSPDGTRLACVSGGANPGLPGEIRVYDTTNSELLFAVPAHARWVRGVAFSPDGQRLVTGGGEFHAPGKVIVWDAERGSPEWELAGHDGAVYAVAFCADGERIVSASQDHRARIWSPDCSPATAVLSGHPGDVTSLAFHPASEQLASAADDGTVRLFDLGTGRASLTIRTQDGPVRSLEFSSDGQYITSSGGALNVPGSISRWNVASGQPDWQAREPANYILRSIVDQAAQRVVSLAYPNMVFVLDAATGDRQHKFSAAHLGPCTCLALHPDGRRLASGATDGTVKIWDVVTANELLTFQAHRRAVSSLAFSADGTRLVTGEGHPDGSFPGQPGEVKLWDADSGQLELTLLGHTESVTSVTFSPDDRRVVSGGRDQTVRLWDVASGQLKLTLRATQGPVMAVAMAADNSAIAAASGNVVHVWSVAR